MSVEVSRRLFSVDEYHRMRDAEILGSSDRLELLEGGIVEMNPIGSRHAACVNKLNSLLHRVLGDSAIIGVQNPVTLDQLSELRPDIALLRKQDDFYATRHPGPGDVQLIIEVADTSLEYDRQLKLPLYAKAGVPEVWLIDLTRGVVEVYADVTAGQFALVAVARGREPIPSRVLGHVVLRAQDVLP
jgi:Uma2 family endonuclease